MTVADARRVRQIAYRQKYLPIQLAATRAKLRLLEMEARRYGMTELLAGPE